MYKIVEYDECLICYQSLLKAMSLMSLLTNDQICYQCRQKLKLKLRVRKFEGHWLVTLYDYHQASDLLIRYKDYLDTALSPIFLSPFIWLINIVFKGYSFVLVPSSASMLKRRNFNHLDLLLKKVRLSKFDCLAKEDSLQRFSKDRITKFSFKEAVILDKVVIFDDVITSGNSIRAALSLLEPVSNRIIIFCMFNSLSEVKK